MDDLISEFITETSESLSTLDLELVKLEQNPDDIEILSNIFRLVHTIKGTCGFLGLPRLESVAHASENVLGKVRDKELEVTQEAISLILESLDKIKEIMDFLSENAAEPEGDDTNLINRLNAFADGGGEKGSGAAASADELEKAFEDAAKQEEAETPELSDAASKETEEKAKPDTKEAQKPAAAPAVVDLTEKAKEEAIQKGLNVASKDGNASNLANQTIRVNLTVLENLMQMVGELVLTRNQLMQIARKYDNSEFNTPLQHLSHITTELQEGVMKTRMQPIGNAWAKFPRLIRDLSLELDKRIELKMIGAETELDRQLLEMIKDPLTHMVRNSCDHGLEGREERSEVDKPEVGTVTLSAYHEGGHIIVDISDDGRGVNIERVKQKALENGLTTEDELEHMTDKQIAQFIFKAGFSTAETVTSVSGRGVGMDVVRSNIEKIGGTVELDSEPGNGSTFHIKIPLTLAIVSVLIVETGGQKFAIPQINVMELVRSGKDSDYKLEVINNSPVMRLRDKLLPLISLSRVLGLQQADELDNLDKKYVAVCKVGASDFGLIVDRIHDTEEIVVKPVSEILSNIQVYSGNTVLGDGSVIMILDPNGIAKTTETELDSISQSSANSDAAGDKGMHQVSFLLFNTQKGPPKAVPLELVSRLEELDISEIEYSDGQPVVQYRDDLMVLTTTDDQKIPKEGLCEIIVFHYDNRTVGLIVDEILDIVKAEPIVKLSAKSDIYLGSIVMAGRSTDVLDVGQVLGRVLDITPEIETLAGTESHEISLLLVEDSMFFRNLTVPFLSALGYRVTAAPGGEEALQLIRKQSFDMIVTDIEMPGMDGFELAKNIRRIEEYKHTPIVAFTSTTNHRIDDLASQSGMNGCVMKTEREELIRMINDCVLDQTEAA